MLARRMNKAGDTAGASPGELLLINEMTTAILLPASFVALCAEGLFLAIADGLDPAGTHSSSGQRTFDRACALVAERQLYSVDPRSSQCPSTVKLMFWCWLKN